MLYGDYPLAMIRLPQRSVSSQSLASTEKQKTEHIPS